MSPEFRRIPLPRESNTVKRDTICNLSLFSLLVFVAVAGRWLGAGRLAGLAAELHSGRGRRPAGWVCVQLDTARASGANRSAGDQQLVARFLWQSGDGGNCLHFISRRAAIRELVATPAIVGQRLRGVLLPSILFFLTTNFAHWLVDAGRAHSMYAAGWNGLAACYAAGVPFLRWMLEGDVLFSGLLFGVYGVALAIGRRRTLARLWFADVRGSLTDSSATSLRTERPPQ